MEVYLIRHTATVLGQSVCYGQADVDVDADFEQEKDRIQVSLQSLPEPDSIFSSPSERCTRLAKALFNEELKIDHRLMELDFGDWELTPWDQIDRRLFDLWADDFVQRSPPGGESLQNLYQRTVHFFDELQGTGSKNVAIVTHAGVIRCIWSYIKKTELRELFRLRVNYGDIFIASFSHGMPTMIKPHL